MEKRHLRRMHADGWKGRTPLRAQYARRVPADAGTGVWRDRTDPSERASSDNDRVSFGAAPKTAGAKRQALGEATVQKYWGVVSVVLNDAKRNQIIAYNPAQCIGKPEAKYREQKIPTDKEAKRFLGLLEQAPVLYRSYFTLMMLTGWKARRTVRAAVEGYPAGMHRSVAEQGQCSGSGSAGGSDKE